METSGTLNNNFVSKLNKKKIYKNIKVRELFQRFQSCQMCYKYTMHKVYKASIAERLQI